MGHLRNYLRVLLCVIFFVVAGLSSNSPIYAQVPPPPSPGDTVTEETPAEFETNPQIVTEEFVNIELIFTGLDDDKSDYRICTGDKKCLGDKVLKMSEISGNLITNNGRALKTYESDEIIDVNNANPDSEDDILDYFASDAEGTVRIKACGDGQEKIKVFDACKKGGLEVLVPQKATGDKNGNYFHARRTYVLSLGVVNDKGTEFTPLRKGGFFVSEAYPTVTIISNNLKTGDSLRMQIARPNLNGEQKRSNYKISIAGGEGYNQRLCIPREKNPDRAGNDMWSTSETNNKFDVYFKNLTLGNYTINIEDQVNEDRSWLGLESGGLLNEKCSGGFDYYKFACTVTKKDGAGGSCQDPNDHKDPNGDEYEAYLKALSTMTDAGFGAHFPCSDGEKTSDPANCKSINTAIGNINVSPQGFIESVFKIVLFLAAFGGIIIIIYSGYMLMMSGGDKEKIAGARDTITAAIVGILFIVLSIVILELIGVQILRLPGFGP